ncbi:hypothetical protein THAOC_08676 [Thalassiosira oceanica]|uniref:Uncharacterized protein n=1 Tax=Thalassiosira oceanica TaxID=159749 RepID=K0THM1_THAOC|nr:hypothetical protein THAOC_08676 [Thalassiosira oceanica]|eukprot:EJK70007.1 hypothetical protein THAOC_08676 [Thalassiosira oceanica]
MSTDIVDESWTENEDGWGGERNKTWRKSQSSAESRQTWWRTNAAPHGRRAGDHQGCPRASGRGLGVDGIAGDDTSLPGQGRGQRVTSTMNLRCDQQEVVYGPAVTGSRARSEQEADYSSRGKGQRRRAGPSSPRPGGNGRVSSGNNNQTAALPVAGASRREAAGGRARQQTPPRGGRGYNAVTTPVPRRARVFGMRAPPRMPAAELACTLIHASLAFALGRRRGV